MMQKLMYTLYFTTKQLMHTVIVVKETTAIKIWWPRQGIKMIKKKDDLVRFSSYLTNHIIYVIW